MRLRSCPWGKPGLSKSDQQKVSRANCLLLASLRILEKIAKRGPVSLEHPADPGAAPYPSIWATPEVCTWEQRIGADRVTYPQCEWGCPAKKLTTIAATVSDLQSFVVPCSHKGHEASLRGRHARNRFRTRLAQSCPSKFCEKLATLHILTMMERGATDEIELNERAVRELVNEVRDRRRRQVRELEVLPRDFALADG